MSTRFGGRRRRLVEVFGGARGGWGVLEVVFAVLDLVGFFDLYEAVTNALTPGIRGLRPEELHFLRPIFGESVPWELVRIDERAWVGPRFARFYYVTFHTINSWGPVPDHVLVHEVVHVWQYVRRGAVYIPRALSAQWSEMGYNYGGLESLRCNERLEDFNYEQQADIIEDFFRLSRGYRAQWHDLGPETMPDYLPYLRELWTEPPPP